MSSRPADPAPPVAVRSASQARPAVQLDGVVKRFGSATALEETWLKVEAGEFLTLLGPSGCGKTTLLNLMAGFLDADQGEIFIGGELVTDMPAHQRQIGIVFQNYALFPHMSVEKNIGYGLRMRGVSRAETAERVRQALDLVKLAGFADRRPRELSGGQQQRVALARALVIRPKVLLLDEPFSALDKNLRGSMQIELKDIQHQLGVTTIFVTHDQSEALSMSDRIVVMSQGRIRQVGTPDEIYRHPKDRFVAAFVGDISALPGRLLRRTGGLAAIAIGHLERDVEAAPLKEVGIGDAVDVFIRPEWLRLSRPGTPGSLPARIGGLVYQGSHVDVYAELDDSLERRLLVRLAGHTAMSTYSIGEKVGVVLPETSVAAFPSETPSVALQAPIR